MIILAGQSLLIDFEKWFCATYTNTLFSQDYSRKQCLIKFFFCSHYGLHVKKEMILNQVLMYFLLFAAGSWLLFCMVCTRSTCLSRSSRTITTWTSTSGHSSKLLFLHLIFFYVCHYWLHMYVLLNQSPFLSFSNKPYKYIFINESSIVLATAKIVS